MVEKQNPVREVGKVLMGPFAQMLVDNKVDPNNVSRTGEKFSIVGAAILMNQERITAVISKFDVGETKAQWIVRAVGGAVWLGGIICDGLDGEVADRANKKTLYGKWLDSLIDRKVDLLPWPIHRLNSQHPMDTAIAEVNLAVDSVPALLRSVKPDVPELAIGSRFPRMITLTGFLLFPSFRRYTGVLLAAQSIVTAYTRYKDIADHGTEKTKRQAASLLRDHFLNYIGSKLNPEGLLCGFSTRAVMVREFSDAKAEEIGLPTAA